METYDAVIIGGSLAGAAAAITLADAGWNVAVLEKAEFPRQKVCGEFLSPGVWPVLRRLGVEENVRAAGGREIDSFELSLPGRGPVRGELPGPERGLGLSRLLFDDLLLTAAAAKGAHVLEKHEAARLVPRPNGTLIEAKNKSGEAVSFSAPIIINAAGDLNRWHTSPKKARGQERRFGFKAHFNGADPGRSVRLYFFPGGYAGLAGVEGGAVNLCGLVSEERLKEARGDFDALLSAASRENPALGEALGGGARCGAWLSCGPAEHGFKRAWAEGIFCAGDAACFVEPFFGQGMTMALAGSVLLGSLLAARGPREAGEKSARRYEKKLRALYRFRLTAGRLLGGLLDSGKKREFAARLFSFYPETVEWLAEKTCAPPKLSRRSVRPVANSLTSS